jgi:CrcB protein
MTVLGIAIGGGLGALVRYRLGWFVAARQDSPFPMATLLVNVTGSLVLGLLVGLIGEGRAPQEWLAWAGVGFCGGLTTFSTFAYETVQLAEQGSWRYAGWNMLLSFALAIGGGALGYAVAAWLG